MASVRSLCETRQQGKTSEILGGPEESCPAEAEGPVAGREFKPNSMIKPTLFGFKGICLNQPIRFEPNPIGF